MVSSPPDFFKLPSKDLLSINNNGDMIFIVDHLNLGSRNFLLKIVAAFNWDKLIVSAMEDIDITFEVVADWIQVPIKLAAGAAYDVV